MEHGQAQVMLFMVKLIHPVDLSTIATEGDTGGFVIVV